MSTIMQWITTCAILLAAIGLIDGRGGCGQPRIPQSRVIFGNQVKPGSWPWQILLFRKGRAICGGSVISHEWVLTAAHCVYGYERQPSTFKVRVGEYNQHRRDVTEENYKVKQIIRHPLYSAAERNYDIALIKLRRRARYNMFVQPVCMPTKDISPGTECLISGWGETYYLGGMTGILQQARLPIVSNAKCHAKNQLSVLVNITPQMICAGNGGKTTASGCHGDSGGPLVCRVGNRWELHGVNSFGPATCDSSKGYDVFARVTVFKDWISRNAGI